MFAEFVPAGTNEFNHFPGGVHVGENFLGSQTCERKEALAEP